MDTNKPYNRRAFLQTSATLLGAAGAASSSAKAAPSDRVNLGFIGMGIRGTHLLKTFQKLPGVNPAGVVDLYDGYLQNARELTDDKLWTGKDYRKLLERKDIDAVTIATPDHWHTRIVLDAISAGKDVYCEKPMTWSLEEGYRIMNAMKTSDRILQIGSEPKSSATTAKAREIVKSGVLGKINLVRAADYRDSKDGAWIYPIPPDASPATVDWNTFLGPAPKIPWSPERFFRWRCWWEYSGGIATDMFVHMLTTLHEILDVKTPANVASNGGTYTWTDGRTVPDVMISVFEYPENFQMQLCVDFGSSKGNVVGRGQVFQGTLGTLVVGGTDGELVIYREDPNQIAKQNAGHFPRKLREAFQHSQGFEADGTPKRPLPKPNDKEVMAVVRDPERPSHMGFFIKSVKDRSHSVEDAEAGHNAAAAAHMASQAYRRHRMVGIDRASGKMVDL
jgi:predicted dehydrogenase